MALKRKLFALTSFSIIDIVLLKLLGGIIFILLTNLLPRAEIGIIGVVAGYLVLFRFISITPESILLRDYPKMKQAINQYLTSFFVFWVLKTVVIVGLGAVVSYLVFLQTGNVTLAFYLFGSVIVLMLGYFQGIIKETHYVSFLQKRVTTLNVIFICAQLGLSLVLFFIPQLLLYLIILLVINVASSVVWMTLLMRSLHFRFDTHQTFKHMKHCIADFSLWQNLTGSITYLIYNIDTFILSFFVSLEVIGDYTIALTIANFFFVIPLVLQRSFTLGFSNISDPATVNRTLSLFIRYSLFVSVAQLVGYYLIGRWIVMIFSSTSVELIYWLSFIIISGISILGVGRPLISLANTKTKIKKLFFLVFLPMGIMSIVIYTLFTLLWGITGTAWGNVVSYSLFLFLLVVYTRREVAFSLTFPLITEDEKRFLKRLVRK